jgi:hypothetical protein
MGASVVIHAVAHVPIAAPSPEMPAAEKTRPR